MPCFAVTSSTRFGSLAPKIRLWSCAPRIDSDPGSVNPPDRRLEITLPPNIAAATANSTDPARMSRRRLIVNRASLASIVLAVLPRANLSSSS